MAKKRPRTAEQVKDETTFPVSEGQTTEEATGEEVVVEEVVVEEPTVEVPAVEEATVEVPAVEEPTVVKDTPLPKNKGSLLMHNVEFELNNFAEAMDPKKSTTKEVSAQWHNTLFLLIKKTLSNTEQSDFDTEWGTILGFVKKNPESVFNEKWIFRNTDAWTGSSDNFDQYRRLMMLILMTADPKERKAAMGDINFELLTQGLKEEQANRLASFYNV